MNYREYVAQVQQQKDYEAAWDHDRLQQQAHENANSLAYTREQLYQARQERDAAAAAGDWEEARLRNSDVGMWQDQERAMSPPQQPQIDQRLVQFAQQNRQFLERHGVQGYQAIDAAHAYMMRPRRSDTNDPRYTGMGWNPRAVFTPQYFDKLKDLLEMHGENYFGVKYDRAEESLTPNEAAKISGLSPNAYNNALHAVNAQGRLGNRNR